MIRSKVMKLRWKDPIYRKKMLGYLKANNNKPSKKIQARKQMLNQWKDKEAKMAWITSKDRCKKISLGALKSWSNPISRKKHIDSMNTEVHKLKCARGGHLVSKSPERSARISKSMLKQYASGERIPLGTGSFSSKWIITKKGGKIFCVGTWEVLMCKALDLNPEVIKFTKNPFRIPYRFEGKCRTYLPDFLVESKGSLKTLEEVKGYLPNKKAITQWEVKKKAGMDFCKARGMQFISLTTLKAVLGREYA